MLYQAMFNLNLPPPSQSACRPKPKIQPRVWRYHRGQGGQKGAAVPDQDPPHLLPLIAQLNVASSGEDVKDGLRGERYPN